MMHDSGVAYRRGVRICLAIAVLVSSVPAVADPSPVRSLLEMRQENVVIQQWDISCGAAALATILTYQLDHPISEKHAAQGMLRRTDPLRVKHRGGFSLLDMKRYAESRGFQAEGYARLSLEQLRKLAPLIVPVNLEGYDHFVVFRGVAAGRAVLADPGFGNRTVALDDFEQAWNGRIGFVVRTRESSAPRNRMPPRRTDLVAVEDEAVAAAMDSELPQPLRDWQMAELPWGVEPAAGARAAGDSAPAAPLSPAEADEIIAGGADVPPLWTSPPVRGIGASVATATGQTVNSAVTPVTNTLAPVTDTTTTAVTPVASTIPPVAQAADAAAAPVARATSTTVAPVADAIAPVATAVSRTTQTVSTAAVEPVTNTASRATQTVSTAVESVTTTTSRTTQTVNTAAEPVTTTTSRTTQTVGKAAEPVTTTTSRTTQTGGKAAEPVTTTTSRTTQTGGKAAEPVTNTTSRTTKAAEPATNTASRTTQTSTGSPVTAPVTRAAAPVVSNSGSSLIRR
jgi:uncharacterized protein